MLQVSFFVSHFWTTSSIWKHLCSAFPLWTELLQTSSCAMLIFILSSFALRPAPIMKIQWPTMSGNQLKTRQIKEGSLPLLSRLTSPRPTPFSRISHPPVRHLAILLPMQNVMAVVRLGTTNVIVPNLVAPAFPTLPLPPPPIGKPLLLVRVSPSPRVPMDVPSSGVASASIGLHPITPPPILVALQVALLLHLVANLREGEEVVEEAGEEVEEVVVMATRTPPT